MAEVGGIVMGSEAMMGHNGQAPGNDLPSLWVVVPCYCEEEVLPQTAPQLLGIIQGLAGKSLCNEESSKLLLVDDGSSDGTWELIKSLANQDRRVAGVRLSRNRGHQNALLCGLAEALSGGCDCAISIDADGQDDANAMYQMLEAFASGSDIVYGVRSDRATDSFLKRETAQTFYRLMAWLGADTVYNHADYRLMSARAIAALLDMPEVNLYLRGMVPLIGFNHSIVEYSREERLAGSSHYPIGKMLSLAVDGVTSLSMKPIRMVSGAGAALTTIGLCSLSIPVLRRKLGMLPIAAASTGMQMLAIGVVGEYVGKTYMEAKRRPRWVVSERVANE